jgi:hypothetical protein
VSHTTIHLVSFVAAAAIASAAACSMGGAPAPNSNNTAPDAGSGGGGGGGDGGVLPFQADPPVVYVAKVKNLLTGLPATDAEVKAVEADTSPDAQVLKGLIDQWTALPQYQTKLLTFFELAFQQTQIAITDLSDQAAPQADVNTGTASLLLQNVRESFALTALQLVANNSPLNNAVTTQSFMMTPALMELYAYLDILQIDDQGVLSDRFRQTTPVTLTIQDQTKIDIADTLNPQSANYMNWYDPDVTLAGSKVAGCAEDPIVFASPASAVALHYVITGSILGRKVGTTQCPPFGGTAAASQLDTTSPNNDFNTWKMVTIRQPNAGEAVTPFYNLPLLRDPKTTELVLQVPRVGFFSTPAFFANWQTNTSNQARVTMNQTLIVALGAMVDGTDTTTPQSTPGLDSAHASDAACFACHQTLDPTRSMFASTFSWNYHNQTEKAFAQQPGLFAFQTVIQQVNNLGDMAKALATHPLFAQGWAEKLCYYANSQACETTDPEFQRIVKAFSDSNFQWSILVRELFSSPLTTNAAATQTTTDEGQVVAVSRRDHLCAAWNARMGFADVCGLDAFTKAQQGNPIPQIVSGLPSDGYGRGSVAPVLPNQPSLFYRAATENLCEDLSQMVIDVPSNKQIAGVKQWSSGQPDAAISDFAQIIMDLTPSDPRSGQAQALLKQHFTDAMAKGGASATDALKSTFTAACTAPSAVSIGL